MYLCKQEKTRNIPIVVPHPPNPRTQYIIIVPHVKQKLNVEIKTKKTKKKIENPKEDPLVDSGTTGNSVCFKMDLEHEIEEHQRITVRLPDGGNVEPEKEGYLPLKQLPMKCRKAYKFKHLKGNSLMSVATLCDNGLEVDFKEKRCS